MASGQIKRSEIAENDLYKEVRDSAKSTIAMLDKLNVGLKKTGQIIQKDLTGNLDKTTAGINKLSNAVKKADTVMAQSVKVDKAKTEAQKAMINAEREMERLKQDQLKTQKMEMSNAQQLQRIKEKENATLQKNAKAVKDQSSAYKQLVITTRDQKNQSKELGAQLLKLEQAGKKNSSEYRKLASTYRQVTNSAKKGDASLKKLDKTVGDNFRNVGNYRGALGKLTGAFGALGVSMGSAMIIRNVFGVIKDFDQSQASLASVLGISRDQMSGLTEQAKQLGATTRFTASQVAELQTELAKLGFGQGQIEAMTGSVLNLAGATGAELGETATIVGSTLRAFGMSAEDTGRLTDVMSKSFSSSALDMSKFATAMSNVAPVAKSAGLNIEETTAMLGALVDNGIDASTAGTGLRNIFLRLSKSGQSYASAMDEINNSTNKGKTAMDLFGVKGSSVSLILAEQQGHVQELTDTLYTSAGATEQMANMQLDTLGGSLDLLSSAWEGYILNASEAGGIGDTLKDGLKFLADNLETILDVVVSVGKAWVTYKAVTILSAGANKVLGMSFIRLGQQAGGAKGVLLGMKGAMKGVGTAFNKLGQALKANAFGLIILALYKLYESFNVVKTEAEQMGAIQEKLNDISAQSAMKLEEEKMQLEVLVDAIKDSNYETGERGRLIDDLNKKYGTNLQNIEDETELLKALDLEQKKIIANIEKRIMQDEVRQKFSALGNEIISLETDQTRLKEQLKNAWSGFGEIIGGFGDYENTASVIQEQIDENQKVLDKLAKKREVLKKDLIKIMKEEANAVGKGKGTGGTGGVNDEEDDDDEDGTKKEKKQKKFNTELKTTYELQQEMIKAYEKELELSRSIEKFTRERQIKELDLLIIKEQELIDAQIAVGKEPDMSTIIDFVNEKRDLIIAGIESERDLIIQKEAEAIDQRYVQEIEKLREQKEKLLEQEDITATAKKKINDNYDAEVKVATEAYLKEANGQKNRESEIYADFNEKIVDATKESQEQIDQIRSRSAEILNAKFDREANEYRLKLLESTRSNEEVEEDYTKFLIDQLEKRIEAMKKLGVDTLDLEMELATMKRKEITDANKDLIDEEKKMVEEQIAIVKGLTDAFNYFTDKRIAKIDEEIAKSQQRYDNYVDLAKAGNINAKESLAVEAKLIAEQNRKKEKLEKQKQRVQLASDALQAYIRNSEDPDVKNPLLKTFSDITLLTQFIQNLPFFEDGIEDTGKTGNGVDGRGGFLSVLHPNERVLTKQQNSKIGDISNDELAKIASLHRSGEMLNKSGAVQIESGWNTKEVVKRLESLENTVRNKPETNIEFERIIDGALQIVRETKQGNTKTYNRYRS
tara:strand:+ start:1962 stop:6005 length:4044 start_codon:yes stop_codon:yes gene_type:complete